MDVEFFVASVFLICVYVFIICPCIPHTFASPHLSYKESLIAGLGFTLIIAAIFGFVIAFLWALGVVLN